MRKYIVILLALLLTSQIGSAKKQKISFDLKFGFIKGGEAVMIVTDTVFNGIPAIHYYLVGRTTGLTDKLFAVNDIYESTVDAKTHLPLKSVRNIKEKKYRWYNETLFFHDVDSIYSQRSGKRSVPHNLVDLISSFFYFANTHLMNDLETGHTVTLATFHADKISDVIIKYLGEAKIETDLGKIDTYVLAPEVDKGKLLNRSDGLQFYISKQKKIPVLLNFDMKVGALRAVIRSYTIDGKEQSIK